MNYQDVFQEDKEFSFEGYQVVRREFFAHTFEPALTVRGNSIFFNTACIRKCENVLYVQLLINEQHKRMVIRPCSGDDKDAVRWCVVKGENRRTRNIKSDIFSGMLYEMMGWDTSYRYKMLGVTFEFQEQTMYLFDLTATEVYMNQSRSVDENGKVTYSRMARYPEKWKDTFGLPVTEHIQYTNVDLFDGYVTFNIKGEKKPEESEDLQEEMFAQSPVISEEMKFEESVVTGDVR